MSFIKKIYIMFISILVTIVLFIPSFSYAGSLNDNQRDALVKTIAYLVETGTKSRAFRYCQANRSSGFNWRVVTSSAPQQTGEWVSLTKAQIENIERVTKQTPKPKYYCTIRAVPIKGAIAFDCSSFVSAVYKFTCNTQFNGPWSSREYGKSSSFFQKSSGITNAKPGDILWRDGHVALYLGDYKNNGKTYIAEASGMIHKAYKQNLKEKLASELIKHPELIKSGSPVLNIDESGLREPQGQVLIREYDLSRNFLDFTHYCTYVGPVEKGDMADLTKIPASGDYNIEDVITLDEYLRFLGSTSIDTSFGNGGTGNGNTGNGGTNNGENNNSGGNNQGSISSPINNVVFWPKDLVLEEQILATSAGYFYKGTPTYGQYIGRIDFFNWLIEAPGNVLDWTIGTVTYGIKAVFIGWTALIENVMSNILNFGISSPSSSATAVFTDITKLEKIGEQNFLAYSEQENSEKFKSVATLADTGTTQSTVPQNAELDSNAEKKKRLTIEDILFNRVPILDINFFDFENAGGQKISSDSLLYKVRESISSWYYIIRMTVIIFMLIALLYLAIKIAISSATDKAEYKSKLMDWLVGFIIIFFIHYFMIAVIYFNNSIVEILDPLAKNSTTVDTPKIESGSNSNITTQNDGQTSLYEAIRIQAYDIKAITGFTATIIYMVLVFYMIRFLIFYAKRLFTLAVLTVFSPIMGLLYTIDKKKYKIGDWGREYVFNVLMQFVHVVIYTVILALAFELTKTSTFVGGVIALMALNFMLIAEGIVKKIFGFNKSASSGNLIDSAVTGIVGYNVGKALFNKTSEKTNNVLSGNSKAVNWFNNLYNTRLSRNVSFSDWEDKNVALENETEEEARERRANQALHSKSVYPNTKKVLSVFGYEKDYLVDKNGVPMTPDYFGEFDKDKGKYFTMSSINNRIEETKREEKKVRRDYAVQGFKDIKNSIAGLASLTAAIPMLVISPKYGLGLGAYGIHALTSSMGRRKIKGAKFDEKERKWTGKRLMFAFATGGLSEGINNMDKNSRDNLYVLETDYPMKLEILERQRVLEDRLARQIIELELAKKASSEDNNIEQVDKNAKKFEDTVKDIDRKEFERAVNLTLEKVKTKDIEKIVKEHFVSMDGINFTNNDIEQICSDLREKVEKNYKAIRINEDFANVVRAEIGNRIVEAEHYVVLEETIQTHSKQNETRENNSSEDIKAKYSRTNEGRDSNNSEDIRAKYSRTNEEKSQTYDKNNNNGMPNQPNKVHVKDDNSKDEKIITRKELEEKIDDLLKEMKQEDLVEIIEDALERKEAINREVRNPRLKDIMQTVSEMSQNNDKYKKLTNEDIYKLYTNNNGNLDNDYDSEGKVKYKDVATLVKNMREYLINYVDGKA